MSCVPRTDLAGESGDPGGGGGDVAPPAAAALVDPVAGAMDVPRNLAAVWVRFATAVAVPEGALAIAAAGAPVAVGAPAVDDCPDGSGGSCVRIPLDDMLMPSAAYAVTVGAGLVDVDGNAVAPGPVGQFVTAADADLTPPVISSLSIQPSGPCVLASFATDEPAAATVVIRSADATQSIPAGSGAVQFSAAASLVAFAPGSALEVTVEVQDRAGNVADSAAVALTVPAGLLPLAITEIHANPAGTEPTQEFVEIRNLGQTSIDVAGLSIQDAKGMDILPDAALGPGAYALIVASGFDPASPKDTPPLEGTALVRVDTRIGSDGLSNSGELVRLVAGDGTVISSYSAAIDVSASSWSGKSIHRVPEDACDQDASWTRHPEDATPGWGAP